MPNAAILPTLIEKVPLGIGSTIMKAVVAHYYNRNSYNEVYRNRGTLTGFESKCIDRFLSGLKQKPHILDVGCGSGIPFGINFISCGCLLDGIDISKKQIQRAKGNMPSARCVNGDFLKYNTDLKYDGISMLYSLFHMKREFHSLALKRAYNLLNSNGAVLINIRREDSGNVKYKPNFCGNPMLWSHYQYKEFRKIAKDVGFKIEVLGDEYGNESSESHLWLLLKK